MSDSEPPNYTKYKAKKQLWPRPDTAKPEAAPRAVPAPDAAGPSRDSRSRPEGGERPAGPDRVRRRPRLRGTKKAGKWTLGFILKRALKLALWWVVISLVVFLVSAQIHQTSVGDSNLLGGAGFPLTKANTILVLGSDARPSGSKEPGAGGASRSDTMMLLRVGGGANAKLSIPRDTLVEIPGHGLDKINAAYAYGGAELAVQTVEQYLSIDVNHVIEVNFENFPKLIDAMGGVSYKGSCVVSKINGGYKNGGYTLRLKAGRTHIDGKQALALARTRKNLCNPRENDLARANRQQKILGAMKWRMLTPMAFVRLPWIAWQAPQTMRTDMSGPTQLGMFGGLMIGGGSSSRVLKPDGVATSPGGGAALTVSPARRERAVSRFMKG